MSVHEADLAPTAGRRSRPPQHAAAASGPQVALQRFAAPTEAGRVAPSPDVVLGLQQRAGNRTVGRWIARSPSGGCSCGSSGGGCSCGSSQASGLQISHPNDPLEREAEAVAHAVLARSAVPGISGDATRRVSRCAGNPDCGCVHDHGDAGPEVAREAAAPSGGAAIDAATRARMEEGFGTSFAGVRVHTDSRAERLSRSVAAEAFTVGSHVYFAAGRYRPGTPSGDHLLAHELVHTLQQGPSEVRRRVSVRSAPRHVQRFGDVTQIPPGLACPVAHDSPVGHIVHIAFPNNVYALTAADRASLDSFVVSWRALGGTDPIRIDGFASTRGPDPLNWQLACRRAEVIRGELLSPASGAVGVPPGLLTMFTHGETDQFGPEADNRRGLVSVMAPVPPPPPPPPPPLPPPGICTPTHTTYGPSPANCAAYSGPLALLYLTDTYRHNARCACLNTPNDPKNNCVRKCLQDKMAGLLAALAAAGPPPPRGTFDPLLPEPHCAAIYRHHVDCYRDCCCGSAFIDFPAFLAMCEMPFPCAFVEGTIGAFNACT